MRDEAERKIEDRSYGIQFELNHYATEPFRHISLNQKVKHINIDETLRFLTKKRVQTTHYC